MVEDFKPSRLLNQGNKLIDAYHTALGPLCKQTGLPLLAVDILLFFSKNPDEATAKDVCKYRGLKPGIVSVHVDRLVGEGYLERVDVPGDRRKFRLLPTEKASFIIEEGKRIQENFGKELIKGLTENDLSELHRILSAIDKNIENVRENGLN